MGINEVIDILQNGQDFGAIAKTLFSLGIFALCIGGIVAFVNGEFGYVVIGGIALFLLVISGFFVEIVTHKPNVNVVNDYIKSLDYNKVYVSDIEKGKIRVTGVSSKKDDDYASVTVDGSIQKLGVFKTEMKVVSDVKDGGDAYITYKKLKKTLPGYYKKGWVKATLHVERGTDLMDLDKYVDEKTGNPAVGTNEEDQACGESSKYVFVKEKGKLTIVCVGKSFDVDNVFKGQTGEVLTYTSFKDAQEWLVKNIKEDKIDPSVLDAKETEENDAFYK